MRLREAILADLPRLQRKAQQLGKINIQDGTKGGRSAMKPEFDMALFLIPVLKGAHATRQRHIQQAERMHEAIRERWG